MRKILSLLVSISILLIAGGLAVAEDLQKFADLGNIRLESGETLKGCRIGYRTFGTMNSGKTNIVLFPMWLGGTTKDLVDLGLAGPGKLIDTSRYFTVAMDTPGNGVSISPSNSRDQGGAAFPRFTIRDVMNIGVMLVGKVAGVSHVRAVMGISMGALVALECGVSFPTLADRIVAIEGTPRISPYTGLWAQAQVRAIESACDVQGDPATGMDTVSAIFSLLSRTPRMISSGTTVADLPGYMAPVDAVFVRYKPSDWVSQLNAIMAHDIYRQFGGSVQKAAEAFKARAMVVVSKQDLIFPPDQIAGFADAIKAEAFDLTGDCGHMAFVCEAPALATAVNAFLERK